MWRKIFDRLTSWKSSGAAPSQLERAKISPVDILSNLYTHTDQTPLGSHYFRDPIQLKNPVSDDNLPIPPIQMFNVYGFESSAAFLQAGEKSASALRSILKDHKISLHDKGAVLDWGCATGRVLRWFAQEAQEIEFWGVDQDDAAITWAKENLSPPFHFVTGTAYPHLPFPDHKFNFIYGLSVFTHLEHFPDLWLMEMQRVMQPGGCAVFTVHDEYTVQYLAKQGRPPWLPADLELAEINKHEVTIIRGDTWGQTVTFFRNDYIEREWGRYFDVAEIRPYSEGYQSAVVLRKR